jgi:hypothetical protein
MNNMVPCILTLLSSEKDEHFRGTYHLYLLGQREKQARHQLKQVTNWLLSASTTVLLSYFFDLEYDVGNI